MAQLAAVSAGQPTEAKPAAAPPPKRAPPDASGPHFGCLSVLLGLLGRPVTLESLSEGMPLSPDGRVAPAVLVRAAERAGFSASIHTRALNRISSLNLPCMLFLQRGEACILVKQEKDFVEIVLPETPDARTRMTPKELAAEHTGEVLFARRRASPEEEVDGAPGGVPHEWFWGTVFRLWPVYSQIILAAVLVNVFSLVTPIFIMAIYDRVVPNTAYETLWALSIGAGVVFGFDFVVRTARSYFIELGGKSADLMLSSRLFEHLMAMRYDARPASAGVTVNNFHGLESVREFFTSATVTAVVDLPFVGLFVFVAYLIAGPVALVGLIAIPASLAVSLLLQYPMNRSVTRAYGETSKKHTVLVESIEGLETIKTTRSAGRAQAMWERFGFGAAQTSMQARIINNLAVNATTLINNMTYVLTVIFGVYAIAEGNLTVGGLVAVSILISRGLAPLGQVAFMIMRLQQSYVALRSLNQMMQLPREDKDRRRFTGHRITKGKIEFKGVSFVYPGTKTEVLKSLSFVVQPGEKVGLIGRIGSGKTTIGKLLVGLYQPAEGTIQVDDVDYRQIDPAVLRSQIGFVSQELYLFHGSVWDNISIGYRSADEAKVLWAAGIAGVDDFIRHHPDGYNLDVGQGGRSLSGGQRESVTIARAVLRDPPVLFLDEPTGSMDNTSEGLLRSRLKEMAAAKTLLLVTHRSSMLALVDRLIIVDQGRIIADGPKDTIIAALAKGGIRASV